MMTSNKKTGIDKTVRVGKKQLRCGFTTGSCAAAAAQGAARMLFLHQTPESVILDTPKGWRLTLALTDQTCSTDKASCAVVKDGGDDIDITSGMKVFAEVSHAPLPGIHLLAGEGVGTVTLNGLPVSIGEPAINPVPRRMITEALQSVIVEAGLSLEQTGVDVTISIPGGEEAAKRTFNPRLGIMGGLSILGTSGIVMPMSEEALKESLRLELSILAAKQNEKQAVFVPGNYGEEFAKQMGVSDSIIIKTSNFLGYMLEEAVALDFHDILLIGDLGKLVKAAAGIFQTHSSVSDARMEIIAAHAAALGAKQKTVNNILACATTPAAIKVLEEDAPEIPEHLYNRLVRLIKQRCQAHVYGELSMEVVLFSRETGLLAQTEGAQAMKQRFETAGTNDHE